ncbi:MAG: hypothetical protein J7K83_02470 [Candidatus Aenigmarchaeota archaeon]|nr:hypothetical protein [Candidatus Aenigmarchaeota archaeon]
MVLKTKWNSLKEDFLYIFIGIFLAFAFDKVLGIILGSEMPLVAVASGSMIHDDSIYPNHYLWLKEHFNYSHDYINSWPVKRGFGIGDILLIKAEKNYSVGDVVVFDASPCEKASIVHRIIAINPNGTYQTKGDHNFYQIPPENLINDPGFCYNERHIEKNKIYGRVIFIIPKLGYIKILVTKLLGGGM